MRLDEGCECESGGDEQEARTGTAALFMRRTKLGRSGGGRAEATAYQVTSQWAGCMFEVPEGSRGTAASTRVTPQPGQTNMRRMPSL